MPRIICRYELCVFNKKQRCTAEEMEYDPDQGCLTAQTREEFAGVIDDEDIEEEEALLPDEEDGELEDDDLAEDLDEDAEDDLFDEDEEDEEDDDEDVRPSHRRL